VEVQVQADEHQRQRRGRDHRGLDVAHQDLQAVLQLLQLDQLLVELEEVAADLLRQVAEEGVVDAQVAHGGDRCMSHLDAQLVGNHAGHAFQIASGTTTLEAYGKRVSKLRSQERFPKHPPEIL